MKTEKKEKRKSGLVLDRTSHPFKKIKPNSGEKRKNICNFSNDKKKLKNSYRMWKRKKKF